MRADISRRIGNFTAVSFLIFLLIVLLVVPVNINFSSQTVGGGQFPQSIIVASSIDTTPHALELIATQDGDNAEPKRVSGFKLDMTNVVAAQVNSQVFVFVTDSSVRVSEAKVRTVSGQLVDLVPSTQADAFSLVNLPVGVYTLDVITQKGNAKAAYEGILVISQQPTTVISETTRNIINQEINQNTRIDIDGDDDDDDGDCPRGYEGKPPFCQKPPCEGAECPEPPKPPEPPCEGAECPEPPGPTPGENGENGDEQGGDTTDEGGGDEQGGGDEGGGDEEGTTEQGGGNQ